jgi:hypothetical protein
MAEVVMTSYGANRREFSRLEVMNGFIKDGLIGYGHFGSIGKGLVELWWVVGIKRWKRTVVQWWLVHLVVRGLIVRSYLLRLWHYELAHEAFDCLRTKQIFEMGYTVLSVPCQDPKMQPR